MATFDDSIALLSTLDEVLETCGDYIEAARHSDNWWRLGVNLTLASRAFKCALELYGEREAQKEKET